MAWVAVGLGRVQLWSPGRVVLCRGAQNDSDFWAGKEGKEGKDISRERGKRREKRGKRRGRDTGLGSLPNLLGTMWSCGAGYLSLGVLHVRFVAQPFEAPLLPIVVKQREPGQEKQ